MPSTLKIASRPKSFIISYDMIDGWDITIDGKPFKIPTTLKRFYTHDNVEGFLFPSWLDFHQDWILDEIREHDLSYTEQQALFEEIQEVELYHFGGC